MPSECPLPFQGISDLKLPQQTLMIDHKKTKVLRILPGPTGTSPGRTLSPVQLQDRWVTMERTTVARAIGRWP